MGLSGLALGEACGAAPKLTPRPDGAAAGEGLSEKVRAGDCSESLLAPSATPLGDVASLCGAVDITGVLVALLHMLDTQY